MAKPSPATRVRPIAFLIALVAAFLVPMASAPAQEVDNPEAGVSDVPPEGYDYTRPDVEDGDTYHYVRNGFAQANIVTRVGSNNQSGTFEPGWLADFTLLDDVRRETIDWAELMLTDTLPAAGPWNQPDVHLPLDDVTVSGDSIVASGNAVIDPDIEAALTYRMLPDSPIVKFELELTNTGTDPFDGWFHYLIDPDSAQDVATVPGVGGTNPGLVESGWTANYVYDGAASAIEEPAQGLAWYENEPAALAANGYIAGLWFDADLDAGGGRTITWYQITDYPASGEVDGNIARWAADLDLLDPDLEDRPRVSGRIADTRTAEGVPGVEVVARNIDSRTVGTAITDEDGSYRMALPPGTYTLTATRLGYQTESRSIEVEQDGGDQALDFEMAPVTAAAGPGKVIPGPTSEGGVDDIVIENELVAMAVSAATEDSQLAPTTVGKPIDMAAAGRSDEIDWFNLPWVSTERPSGPEAWQSLTVANDSVEVTESGPGRAEVTVHGTWTESSDLEITTTYAIEPDQPWITAETVFSNTGNTGLDVWLGDVVDHDAAGQSSFVPGTGVVSNPYGSPGAFSPEQPWIAQAGTAAQVYGLLYTGDETGFEAYGTVNWMSSQFDVTIPANDSFTLDRRVVAMATEPDEDRFAAFGEFYEDYLAEQTGISVAFDVGATALAVDESTTATAVVTNSGDEDVTGVEVSLSVPANLATDEDITTTVDVPAGEQTTVTWPLTAVEGGRSSVGLATTYEGQTLSRSVSVFVDGPGWYWGDNHSHSRHSDGSGTIAENFASARRYGLSWLTATDHNTISQAADVAQENRDDFVALFGEEITSGDGHSLGYNIDELINWTQPPQDRIDQTNASNDGAGFFFVAHPFYPGLEWEDWTIEDYAGIEVWNGFYPPRHAVNTQAFAKWDELNNAGMHLIGIANSDAHNPGKVGSPHIRAYLPELAEEEIWTAMESGRFYGSDGPDLRFTLDDATMGQDLEINAGGETVAASITGLADEEITELTLLRDGEVVQTWSPEMTSVTQSFDLDVTPGEFYRVELETATQRFAFSNPIWIVESPDACPDGPGSDATVAFGDDPRADSGVPNHDLGDGCTILDAIFDEEPWRNHGQFVRSVAAVLRDLRADDVVNGRESGRIQSAAARSDIGKSG